MKKIIKTIIIASTIFSLCTPQLNARNGRGRGGRGRMAGRRGRGGGGRRWAGGRRWRGRGRHWRRPAVVRRPWRRGWWGPGIAVGTYAPGIYGGRSCYFEPITNRTQYSIAVSDGYNRTVIINPGETKSVSALRGPIVIDNVTY